MRTVSLNLRLSLPERVAVFEAGLRRLGFEVRIGVHPADVLVTWNRIGNVDRLAANYERVLVVENATWGNRFCGGKWLHMARDRHNTAGMFPIGGPERWDSLGVELADWKKEGETVVLAQRGIGSPPTAMPYGWPEQAAKKYGGRIRRHPGRSIGKPLADDLASCGQVVTWGSGSAVLALMSGIPVISDMPDWIGAQDNSDAGRLAMLRNLAWAQWTLDEIASGTPFDRLL